MIKTIVAAASAGLALSSVAQAQPRMANVERDLRSAVLDVCIPAQASDDFAATIGERAATEGYYDQPMNRQSMKVYHVSNDDRVLLTPTEESCTASFVTDDRTDDVTDKVYAAIAEGAVHRQEIAIKRGKGWVFCHQAEDGFVGSVTLITQVYEDAPKLGERRPTKVRRFLASVPRTSACQAG